MIFQEPMTSLSALYTIGNQVMENLLLHQNVTKQEAREKAIDLLRQVGIAKPEQRVDEYPHQFSGGMRQRAMIAMAIACNPRLLIADEPTTALDVTIQAQILDLLISLQKSHGMGMVLITHDMAVISETAQTVQVMYAGQVVEVRPAGELFQCPSHPYTAALLSSLPGRAKRRARLPTIPGVVPGIGDRPRGCLFNPRCRFVFDRCLVEVPPPSGPARTRCHTPLDESGVPQEARALA